MFDDAPTSFLLSLGPRADTERGMPAAQVSSHVVVTSPLHATVKHSEHHAIRAALEASRSREEAAQKLGISPRTLRYKLARLRDAAPALAAHS